MTDEPELDLLRGTLDIMILKALAWGPRHGYAIARWIKTSSDDALGLEDRTLYIALHRLEAAGLVKGSSAVTASGRRARSYALTAEGERRLRSSVAQWKRYVAAMGRLLKSRFAEESS